MKSKKEKGKKWDGKSRVCEADLYRKNFENKSILKSRKKTDRRD